MKTNRTRRSLGWQSLFTLALVASAAPVFAAAPDQWVPARWQGGPLEIQRRAQKDKAGVKPEAAAAIKAWYQPSTLEFLNGSAINCLLVTWSAGQDAAIEQEQQQLVADYAKAARAKAISVLGLVYAGADAARAAAAAQKAGLEGLVLDGEFPNAKEFVEAAKKAAGSGAPFLVLQAGTRATSLAGDPAVPRLVTGEAPLVRAMSDEDLATATPTTEPWIASNLWMVRSMRGVNPAPVWLSFGLEQVSADDYARAIADAAAAGGRWVVAPDDALKAGLAAKDEKSQATWRRVCTYLSFFEEHAEWRGHKAGGTLAIVQDRATQNPEMFDEYLNLVTRRRVPFRVIDRAAFSAAAIAGLRAVLAADMTPPTPEERKVLDAFMQGGGIVLAGSTWPRPEGAADKTTDFTIIEAAKGQFVAFNDEIADPETVAREMASLVGENEVGIRLFNAPSTLPYPTTDASGSRTVVQLVNYATTPADEMTVRVAGEYRTARILSPDAPPGNLELQKEDGSVQVRLPAIPVYAAVSFEK